MYVLIDFHVVNAADRVNQPYNSHAHSRRDWLRADVATPTEQVSVADDVLFRCDSGSD